MKLPERSGDESLIGIAITVPEPHGSALQAARGQFGDPMAAFIPPHITIIGPTAVSPADAPEVAAHLDEVVTRHAPFTVRLRGTGTFRPVSQVAFVQVADGIAACEQLETDARSGPLDQELRFHYHPHVTVAHELEDAALDDAIDALTSFDATFQVESLDCYEHGADGVWRVLSTHALTGDGADAEAVHRA